MNIKKELTFLKKIYILCVYYIFIFNGLLNKVFLMLVDACFIALQSNKKLTYVEELIHKHNISFLLPANFHTRNDSYLSFIFLFCCFTKV